MADNGKQQKKSGEVETELKKSRDFIIGTIEANAYIIADSFGTGMKSSFSFSDEIYQQYRASSYWNKLRRDRRIVGRARGTYVNFFGRRMKTKGTMAGRFIPIHEIEPSGTIDDAWNDFFEFGLPIAIDKVLDKINYSKYFQFR